MRKKMDKIKSGIGEIWRTMVKGLFAMLPGVLFTAIPVILLDWVGYDATSNVAIFLFGGACGGCWMMKRMNLNEIEKMPDQAKKWEIYDKVRSS